MSEAAAIERLTAERRGVLKRILFPSIEVRFAVSMLLTFFPYAILYPLDYPAAELVTMASWVWVFPSLPGMLTLGILPFVPEVRTGYFAFNLFCICGSISIACAASRRREWTPELVARCYRLARLAMMVTLGICALQAVTNPDMWVAVFSRMVLIDRRGAGLRLEPSLLAGPFMLYMLLLAWRADATHLLGDHAASRSAVLREGFVLMTLMVLATRSVSVLITALVFMPVLVLKRRTLWIAVTASIAGPSAAMILFGERIQQAQEAGSGSFIDLITVGSDSWRNIPDLLIGLNAGSFMLPGDPTDIRSKINAYAVALDPGLGWIENTYSTFASGATTLGLLAVGGLLAAGLGMGLKRTRASAPLALSWLLLYGTNCFLTPKYEAAGWVVLGMLPLLHTLNSPFQEPEKIPAH